MPLARWTNQDVTLYHGTTTSSAANILQGGAQLAYGNPHADFGPGFYMTTNLKQASQHATKLSVRRQDRAAILKVLIQRERLATLDTLAFVLGSPEALDYWSLIQSCRNNAPGHGRLGPNPFYDVIFGPVTRNFHNQTLHIGYDQVSFHTQTAMELLNLGCEKRMITL